MTLYSASPYGLQEEFYILLVATRTTPFFVVVPLYFVHDCNHNDEIKKCFAKI